MNKYFWKKLSSFTLSVSLVLGLTACGSGNGEKLSDDDGENTGNVIGGAVSEWVYVPEFLELDGTVSLYNTTIIGDDIYYTSSEYDEETENWVRFLCRRSLTGGEETRLLLDMPENASMNYWNVGDDGTVYALLSAYEWDEVRQTGDRFYWVARYDDQGNQVFVNDISSLINSSGDDNTYLQDMCVDSEGRFYLAGNGNGNYMMWFFDEEGNAQGSTSFSEWLNNLFSGGNGRVYTTYYDDIRNGYVMAEVNFDQKSLGTVYANIPGYGSGMYPLSETAFLTYDGVNAYEYDMESQTAEALFTFLDSDINGDGVNALSVLSDGRIAVIYNDWTLNDRGIALLTKTSTAQVPQKQEIVIAVLGMGSMYQAAAVQFNKASDLYHIRIRDYLETVNRSETAYSDALTNLNNDITSSNCPDIIELSSVNVSQLSAKGVFEDLAPYLERSAVLDRADMIENVLDAYTYDGVLVGIPNSFYLRTILGAADMVGEEPGWTLEDMIALADAHPDKMLFYRYSKSRILNYCLSYNMDRFVDWSEGTCSFDTKEFKRLLEFANRFPDEDSIDWESGSSEAGMISKGEVLLASNSFHGFDDLQMYAAMFGGDVTCIGYPNSDGSSGCILNATGAMAITAKSNNKDGAWAFIESYMNLDDRYSFGFPNSRSKLEAMVKKAVEPQYFLDENGDPYLDENGEPMVMMGTASVSYGNDWSYEYRMTTQEEADQILALVDVAKPSSPTNDQISMIISEEAEPFFQGQKSVDDVAVIIQSRAGIYVSENS